MTTVIDERVVEMRFNNEDFEKNVAQSMNTLDNLKKSLDFDSAKSLENLGKASKNFSLSGITETITEATSKFSALEIAGITAIANITNKAMDFGINFAKSLSIDQVTSGFSKFATKTSSVQTIMSATSDQFENQTEQMDYVMEQLDKLTWFADETSYSMTDMTNNIGKFVSNNIQLDQAVTAMEGIATWAGLSGANVNEASRAMYNFSQAMGAGAMKLMDWKSIENANMATTKFKQTAIDTAVELGKLKKSADGLVTTLDGKTEVSITQFSESLKKKWFDTETMTATLGKFGKFADELYNLSNATNLTASELLEALDDYKAGSLNLNEIAEDSTMSIGELNEKFKELTGEGFELGKKAFAAAQEAKTFQEAIDSVKDAVSSGWMNTFEIIFGNYLEAKALWTGLANNLYDMFAEGGNKRNEVLKVWKELGGRDSLIMGAVEALNLLIKPIEVFKKAFDSMLPKGKDFGALLADLTRRFYEFFARIQPSEESLLNLFQFFRGLFSIGKTIISVFGQIAKAILPITKPLGGVLHSLISFLGYVGAVLEAISNYISENNLIAHGIEILAVALKKVLEVLKVVGLIFAGGLFIGIKTFIGLIQKATTVVTNFTNFAGTKLAWVGSKISGVFSKVAGIFDKFSKTQKKNSDVVLKIGRAYDSTGKLIGNVGRQVEDAGFQTAKQMTLLDRFLEVLNKAKNVLVTFGTVVGGAILALGTKIFKFFTDFKQRFQDVTANATTWIDYIKGFFETIKSLFAEGWEKAKEFFAEFGIDLSTLETAFETIKSGLTTIIDKLGPGRIAALGFATAMLALVGAAIKLSDSFRTMFGAVTGLFNNINKILKKQFAKSSIVTDLAKAFAILAGSLTLLAFVDATYHDNLMNVAQIMTKLMIVFTACAAALRLLDLLMSKFDIDTDFNLINSNILALAGSMTLLVAAFAILNLVELKEDWPKKLAIMGVLMVGLGAAAAVISKIAPQLSKGSLLLLSLALSMKLMVDALAKIGEEDINGINKNIAGFTVLFLGVAALTAAAGQLKLTSALNLLILAKAITMLMPQITEMLKTISPYLTEMITRLDNMQADFSKAKDLVKKVFDKANDFFNYLYERFSESTATVLSVTTMIAGTIFSIAGLAAVVVSGFALAKIIAAIGSLGNVFKGIGIAIIGLAIGVKIVTESVIQLGEYTKYLTDRQYSQMIQAFAIVTLFLTASMAFATFIDAVATHMVQNGIYDGKSIRTNFLGMAAAFVGIGLAMKLIVASLKDIQNLKEDTFWPVIGAMSVLILCLGIAAGLSGMITKGGSALLGLIGIAVTMALLIAELGVLSAMWTSDNERGMYFGLLSMVGIFLSLSLVLNMLSKLKVGPTLSLMLPLLGVVVTLTGLVIVLSALENPNYGALIVGLAGVIGILIALGKIMKYIVDMPNLGGGRGLKNKINLLKTCVIALAGVAAAVAGMGIAAKFLGWNLAGGLAALLGGIGLIVGIFAFITHTKALQGTALKNKLTLLAASVASLLRVAVILAGAAATISHFGGNNVAIAFGLLSAQLAVVVGIMAWITSMKSLSRDETINKILLLGACALALIPLAGALALLSTQDINDNWNSLFILSAGLTALTGVLVVITKVLDTVVDLSTIIGSIGMIISACGMIWSLAGAICMLSNIDSAQLTAATQALQDFAGALGILLGVMGVLEVVIVALASAFGPQGGMVGAAALPGLIISIGLAAIALGAGLKLAAEGVVILSTGLEDLASSLEKIAGLDLASIATGMAEIAGAGLAMGAAAGSVEAFAGAMNGLAGALSSYNSAAHGGPSGGGGVTFEYFDGANTAIKETESIVEGSYENIKTYTELTNEAVTGTIENIPKLEEATEDLFTKPWKSLNQMEKAARDAGYHTVDAYVEAINSGLEKTPDFSKPKGIIETWLKDLWETGKEKALPAGQEVINNLSNGMLNGANGTLSSVIGYIDGMIGNLLGKYAAIFNYAGLINKTGKEISRFGANGMPTDVISKKYEQFGGVAGGALDKVKMKLDDLGLSTNKILDVGWDYNDMLQKGKDIVSEFTDATNGGAGALDNFGDSAGKAGKAAKDAANDLKSSLMDTIESQLDIFSKFDLKMGVSADQMLENMRSNIDGFASWSHRMTVLAERGIDQGLLKKLAELGPKGYETMNAFYEMSEDQLAEANELYKTSLTLPEGQADIVASAYQYAGEMAIQGFSNALDDHRALHESIHGIKEDSDKDLREDWQIASPSKYMYMIGDYIMQGLNLGMQNQWKFIEGTITAITDKMKELFSTSLDPEEFDDYGEGYVTEMLKSFVGEGFEDGNPVITTFIETLAVYDSLDEALIAFAEHLKEFLYELFEIPGDEEPSEWFKRLVKISILQTVINTITEKTVDVITAVTTLCKAIIEAAAGIFKMTAGDEGFSRSEVFYQMGVAAVLGLAEGLKDEAAVGEAIDAAIALATAVNNAVANTLEVNSPSKVMIRMGHSVGEGLTIGITDGAENVYKAAQSVAEGTIDAMSEVGRLQDAINTGIDFNPIITPMFDLSYIKSQMSELDGLMNDPEYGLNGQNEGKGGKVTNVNYTQNNYSPKSLTRYEIYRQTKNQLSSLKGALG